MGDQDNLSMCADVQRNLNDYLDQELPPQEAYAILEHLGDCAACAALSQRNYLALARLRAAMQRLPLPRDMASRLYARLDASRPNPESER